MATNRKDKRAALAAFLPTYLTSADASNILTSEPSDLTGQSPVVYLKSAGSGDVILSQGFTQEKLLLEVHTLVLFRDLNATPPYTSTDADDTMDDLDAQLRGMLETKWNTSAAWQDLRQIGPSKMLTNKEVEGRTYNHEVRVFEVTP